jgi:hypothetical protein
MELIPDTLAKASFKTSPQNPPAARDAPRVHHISFAIVGDFFDSSGFEIGFDFGAI